MTDRIQLGREGLPFIRRADSRLISYNIEMTEVTGGTFWKEYTPAQIAGTEEFPRPAGLAGLAEMMQFYPPIDLGGEKIRAYAGALGPAWIRVSGSWATATYYDFDGGCGGKIPEGYRAVLTARQWEGVLDFVKAVGGKLLVSLANCPGSHPGGKPWTCEQAKLLFDFSAERGVPVSAAEFMNEPNVMATNPPAPGYGVREFCRDQDSFYDFVRANYPRMILAGPSACGEAVSERQAVLQKTFRQLPTRDLMEGCARRPDVFSYHYYTGLSERGALFGCHWPESEALSEEYLGMAGRAAEHYRRIRDEYCPGVPMWITESADAGLGGNTWGSTYLDTLRYAAELGSFTRITDGVIFHNTLASSDYGLLDHRTHEPRPNYWLLYVWKRLAGDGVYDSGTAPREGARVYAFSRRDGKPGYAYVVLNTSRVSPLRVDAPEGSLIYRFASDSLRGGRVWLNGRLLERGADGEMPALVPEETDGGKAVLGPAEIGFFTV